MTLGLTLMALVNLVPNGGMEPPYVRGIAHRWEPNCYGENVVEFRAETESPRSGKAAQAVICKRFKSGGVQIRCWGISVREGQPRTLTVWLKGNVKGPVFVGVRKHGKPYTKYLHKFVRVKPYWRRYTIIGESKGTDPDCGVYIAFFGEGTLYIDDVSLVPGRHPPTTPGVGAPPVKGNRVYNGSFELGTAGWAPVGKGLEAMEAPGAPHGKFAMRRKLSSPGVIAECRPFRITGGQVYTVSAFLRREEGPSEVVVQLVEYADPGGDRPTERDKVEGVVEVDKNWRRASVTGIPEAPFTEGYMARFVARKPGTYWLDAVQVEEGGLTAFSPRRPVEVSLFVPMLERYVEPKGKAVGGARIYSESPLPEGKRLSVRLFDLWGREVWRREFPLHVEGRRASSEVELRPPDFGIYRAEAQVEGTDCSPGEAIICVLPPLSSVKPDPGSFFGTHAPPSIEPGSPNLAVKASLRAGARWHRIHDFANYVQWYWVEPSPGRFVWFDAEIDFLRRAGFNLLGTLCRTPLWAGRKGPEHRVYGSWTSAPPKDLSLFARYVERTAEHYRGRIGCWEIWNEPYGRGFFSGAPEEYAELLEAGYKACKRADPRCTVLGMCAYPGLPEWIERALRRGALGWMDVFSYHTYFTPRHVREGEDGLPPLVEDVRRLKALMRKYGPEKPIWHTEGGVLCPSLYSWLPLDCWRWDAREAASTVAKCVALLISEGVEKWFYYYAGYPWGGRGDFYTLMNAAYILVDYDGSPKATLAALSAASRLLDRAELAKAVREGDFRAYVFEREGESVAVCWLEGEAPLPRPFRLPRGSVALNMVGAREKRPVLSSEPIYIVAKGMKPRDLTLTPFSNLGL